MKKEVLSITPLLILVIVFFLIFSLLSVSRHLHFYSNGDLGHFDLVMWRLSTFQYPYSSLIHRCDFGDHFSPILFLFVPLYQIWSSPLLLVIIQAFFVAMTAFPLYKIAEKYLKSTLLSLGIILLYFLFVGLQNAVEFDFHPITIGVFFISMTFFALFYDNSFLYWLFLGLSLLVREDVPPLIVALGIWELAILKKYRLGFLTVLVSFLYFYLVIFKIMPFFGGEIGGGKMDSPNFSFWAFLDYPPKRNTLLVTFQSFGFLPIFSAFSYFLGLPQLASRFLFSLPNRWGIEFHYSATLTPILTTGTILGLKNIFRLEEQVLRVFKKSSKKNVTCLLTGLIFVCLALVQTLVVNQKYQPFIYYLFKKETYVLDKTTKNARKLISLIPPSVAVSAQLPFVPHLSQRDKIFFFPEGKDRAEYIILSLERSTYPLSYWEIKEEIGRLEMSNSFKLAAREGDTYLFKKVKKGIRIE